MARNGALRRAGLPVVVGLALVLGGITVGYGWIVARHLRDDARQTSGLLGRVFAGLNDPGPDAATDALHMALAAVHGMNYLLTWNCRHIANASIRRAVEHQCRLAGYEPPVICTPQELIER